MEKMKIIYVVVFGSFFLAQSAISAPKYDKFNLYINSFVHGQLYCKNDFSQKGLMFIKKHFKYAVSNCNYSIKMLSSDRKMQQAYHYYRQQAENGNGKSAYLIGYATMMGLGVDSRNDTLAPLKWFKLSARLNYPLGISTYADALMSTWNGSQTSLKSIDNAQQMLYKRATKLNDKKACLFFVNYYLHKRNKKMFVYWLDKAISLSSQKAKLIKAVSLYNGELLERNTPEAVRLFQEGLTAKTLPIKIYAELLSNLANAYLDGAGTVKNYSKAYYYYKLSAHLNFVTAQNYLADMYYSGQGVHKNLKKANYWYCKAEAKGYKPSHPCKQ